MHGLRAGKLDSFLPDLTAYGYLRLIECREIDDQFVATRAEVLDTK